MQFRRARLAAKVHGRSDPEALDELARSGGEPVSARYRHQHLRVQWANRHTRLREKTDRDDDTTREEGGRTFGQTVEVSRGHAEALVQI